MWLCCRLDVDDRSRKVQRDDNRAFNGRKRTLMAPRRYTELFFLDEAIFTNTLSGLSISQRSSPSKSPNRQPFRGGGRGVVIAHDDGGISLDSELVVTPLQDWDGERFESSANIEVD